MKFLLFVFLCFVIFSCVGQSVSNQKENVENLLDCRHIMFSDNSKISIDTDWEFYWKQLLTPDDFIKNENLIRPNLISLKNWNMMSIDGQKLTPFGYATYRCKVIIPSDAPLMGLFLPGVFSSAKIWIGGEMMREVGVVGTNQDDTRHYKTDLTIPFSTKSDTVDIVIQVSNFYHTNGGIIYPPVIGSSRHLLAEERLHTIASMLYIGSLWFMGTFFLLFYLLYWRKDSAVVYFALFCLCWSYRELSASYAPIASLIPGMSWSVHVRLEYVSLFLGALAGSVFLGKIFKAFAHQHYSRIISYIITVFIICALVLPSHIYTNLLIPFFATMGLNLMYIVFILVKGVLAGRKESRLAILSVILAIVILSLHMSSFVGGDVESMIYVYIGYLGVFLLNSMMLGMRFSKSFFKLERLQAKTLDQKEEISAQADQLTVMNVNLSQRTMELKEKNKQINHINKTLEKKVAKRTSRLAAINSELDTFLYKSSHDLRRPVKSLLGLTYLADRTITDNDARILFNKIERSARSMDALLGRLVEINEIKDHSYTRQSIDCKALMQRLINDAKALVMKADSIDFRLNHPEVINDDPVMLYTLLFELFKNSSVWVDHIQHALVIECEIIKYGGKTRVSISDNGPGISAELIDEVFSMYKVGNEKTGGYGLGLYIVGKILEKMKGEIELKSNVNLGTVVIITLHSN